MSSPVHDVQVQVVCPVVQHLLALLSQTGEVCIQDGRTCLALARTHSQPLSCIVSRSQTLRVWLRETTRNYMSCKRLQTFSLPVVNRITLSSFVQQKNGPRVQATCWAISGEVSLVFWLETDPLHGIGVDLLDMQKHPLQTFCLS